MARVFEFFNERTRTTEFEPLGVIDIGSNSVRLVVYEGAVRAAAPLFNEKVLCGLGRSIATTGRLSDDSSARAIAALTRFHAIARLLRVKNLRAIATAAVREAENGVEFIKLAELACGTNVEVLSGDKEAELVAYGIRMGFMRPDGVAGDLGGGSLELIDINDDKLLHSTTLRLGGLRLIDATGDKIEKAVALIESEMEQLEWFAGAKGRPFYCVGGTWRALGRLHMEDTKYPLRVIHGYAIPTPEAIAFCESVRKAKKVSSLPGIQDVSRARRDVLPYGALVLEHILKRLEPSHVVISVFGIREGTLFSLLPRFEQKKDPLICFCEDFARLRSRSLDHARELCTWTDALFGAGRIEESPEERRLRHAACLVSDIGWRAHPDYRGEQSLNLVAHSGMAGIDHPGRIFLALSIYYRHVGLGADDNAELSARFKTAVDKHVHRRARIVGAAVRTAHMLSIGMPGVIDETRLSYEDGGILVLHLPKVHRDLDGERLRRRLDILAEQVNCKAEIRVN